jgi:menaquinone-9 beta-reductase
LPSTTNTDIIIAGAGPAGAATSLFLCKEKIPHVIIDKAKFPRDKICGDALSGKVVEVLNLLDPSLVKKLYSDPSLFLGSYGVKFAAPNANFVDIPFKIDISQLKHAPGFISKRIHFDNFLFEQIDRQYATIIEEASITEINYTDKGLNVVYDRAGEKKTASCKLLVGAEGDRSIVARKLAHHSMEPEHYCAGLRAYYKGVTNFHAQDFIELHFIKELLPGYLWVFPLPNGEANVGVGMLSKAASKKKINLKQVMLKSC